MNRLYEQTEQFKTVVWQFYKNNGRHFAWRNVENPYYVVISEIMLQQTQTSRVEEKYEQFITAFPSFEQLARASLHDVLYVWQGLGYYRRARFLHQMAQKVVQEYNGIVPSDLQLLITFPGVGHATASSICAFAFNIPTVFIETNIRTVFIHSFFSARSAIHDNELLPLIAATVDSGNPREWYYALMDYGVYLKTDHKNPSRHSAHYVKQSKFEGSERQIRAHILKLIVNNKSVSYETIIGSLPYNKEGCIQKIIKQLEKEEMIRRTPDDFYSIAQ